MPCFHQLSSNHQKYLLYVLIQIHNHLSNTFSLLLSCPKQIPSKSISHQLINRTCISISLRTSKRRRRCLSWTSLKSGMMFWLEITPNTMIQIALHLLNVYWLCTKNTKDSTTFLRSQSISNPNIRRTRPFLLLLTW